MRVPHPTDMLFLFDKRLYQAIPKKGVMPDSRDHEDQLRGMYRAISRLVSAMQWLLFIPAVLTLMFDWIMSTALGLIFSGLILFQFYLMYKDFRLSRYLFNVQIERTNEVMGDLFEKLKDHNEDLKELLKRKADSQESQDNNKGP